MLLFSRKYPKIASGYGIIHTCRRSSAVEQRFCKAKVSGSIPLVGSRQLRQIRVRKEVKQTIMSKEVQTIFIKAKVEQSFLRHRQLVGEFKLSAPEASSRVVLESQRGLDIFWPNADIVEPLKIVALGGVRPDFRIAEQGGFRSRREIVSWDGGAVKRTRL